MKDGFVDFNKALEKHREKLKKIKVFITDVDGVLTDGQLYWSGEEVGFNRFFHALDGYALKMLKKFGFKVAILSGGDSLGLRKRVENMGIELAMLGNEDKRKGYLEILEKTGAKDEECLYIGDEFFDLPILNKVGFSATTSYASPEILDSVDYITTRPPGMGCCREVADLLRMAHGLTPEHAEFS